MSTNQQVQKTILDVISIDSPDDLNWSEGYLKRLSSATTTLYNASLNKVVLKPSEEAARCHICAFMACQKLQEKGMPELQFFMDNIPIEPKKVTHLIDVFKQQLYQMSPVKGIQWSPSPKKRKSRKLSPIKNNDRFTATDPQELREQLFGTPTKRGRGTTNIEDKGIIPATTPLFANDPTEEPSEESPRTPRRKLAFEEDDSDEETALINNKSRQTRSKRAKIPKDDRETKTKGTQSIFGGKNINTETTIDDEKDSDETDEEYHSAQDTTANISQESDFNDTEITEDTLNDLKTSAGRKSKAIEDDQKAKKKYTYKPADPNNYLTKRYAKINIKEVLDLANEFELPKDVTINVLDSFLINSSYLLCPWQFACGLIMNCVYIVFHERRVKDPRIDHLIIAKMVHRMGCNGPEDVIECMKIVKEALTGEKWFRDLQMNNNYFDGKIYEEVIISKLGSMLQQKNILVTDEQYEVWKRRIEQDLSLRHS